MVTIYVKRKALGNIINQSVGTSIRPSGRLHINSRVAGGREGGRAGSVFSCLMTYVGFIKSSAA